MIIYFIKMKLFVRLSYSYYKSYIIENFYLLKFIFMKLKNNLYFLVFIEIIYLNIIIIYDKK